MDYRDCTIITSCDGKSRPESKPYSEMAVRLVRSIRKWGGQDVPIIATHDAKFPPLPGHYKMLLELGVDLRPLEMEGEKPLFHKILACKTKVETPVKIWMDSDIYVRRYAIHNLWDISTRVDFAAPPTTHSGHRWARQEDNHLWERMYDAVCVQPPAIGVKTHIDQKFSNLYFCSGLIIIRDPKFPATWEFAARKVLELGPEFVESFSQTSLTLAVLMRGLHFQVIEEDLHYVYSLRRDLPSWVQLIHYQDERVKEISDELWNV